MGKVKSFPPKAAINLIYSYTNDNVIHLNSHSPTLLPCVMRQLREAQRGLLFMASPADLITHGMWESDDNKCSRKTCARALIARVECLRWLQMAVMIITAVK